MEDDRQEIDIPGEFSKVEGAVLIYLYNHPKSVIGVKGLIRLLKPDRDTPKKQRQAYEEIFEAVETLIGRRLVNGERIKRAGMLSYQKLRLTTKGQAETIKEKKREKAFVVIHEHVGKDKTIIDIDETLRRR
jgi:hypothetical protein